MTPAEAHAKGLPVLPCGFDKRPLISSWKALQSRPATDAEFQAWQRLSPPVWALVTGKVAGRITLDFDGAAGGETMRQLGIEPHRRTPSGGYHADFVYPGWDVQTVNSKSKRELGRRWPGLDIRGDGGYVAFAGRTDKGEYIWLRDPAPYPLDILPADLREFLGLMQAPAAAARRPKTGNVRQMPANGRVDSGKLVRAALDRVGREGRNDAGFWLAIQLRDNGYSQAEAEELIQRYATCVPDVNTKGQREPYTSREALATVREAFSRPAREPWAPRKNGTAPGGVSRSPSRAGTGSPSGESETDVSGFSDDALAAYFTARHGENSRFTAAWGSWHQWDGRQWARDKTLHVFDRVRALCREVAVTAKPAAAARIKSAATVAAVERLARADRRHAAVVEQWDADPWLLNTPGGLVDLRTSIIQPHRREAYSTKMTAATPGGACPLWLAFLDRVTDGNCDIQAFLRRMVGYCLTADTREQALFFLFGNGANGKSVFLSTVAGILNDYAKSAAIETFVASPGEHHPTDLAGLQGARLVTAVEVDDGRKWAESKIKALTGGDRIAARFMRQDFFEFTPVFKLLIAGNHKPGLRSVDEAIRRRFHLIPFTVTIPPAERDLSLGQKLHAEWDGILAWALQGCREWQAHGLNAPAAIADATDDYLAAEDNFGQWLESRCVRLPNATATAERLFADWRIWAESAGEYVGSQKHFSQTLEARGFVRVRLGAAGTRGFAGIGLRAMNLGDGE
jgi:P4 family phage/plasmid primase-like protien